MFRGDLVFTCSRDVAMLNALEDKIVTIGEPDPILESKIHPIHANCIGCDFGLSQLRLDNSPEFIPAYFNKLTTDPNAAEMLAIICRVLFNDKTVIIYSSKDEWDLYYKELYQFFRTQLGICPGIVNIPGLQDCTCAFDENFRPAVSSMMFMFNYLTFDEFIAVYPKDTNINYEVTVKIANDVKPYIPNYTQQTINEWFLNFKKSMVENQKPLMNIMQKAR